MVWPFVDALVLHCAQVKVIPHFTSLKQSDKVILKEELANLRATQNLENIARYFHHELHGPDLVIALERCVPLPKYLNDNDIGAEMRLNFCSQVAFGVSSGGDKPQRLTPWQALAFLAGQDTTVWRLSLEDE